MNQLLKEKRFDFIPEEGKGFILAFDNEMTRLGYEFGGKIGSGYCWGRYMIIYTKARVRSKKVFARVYIRDESLVLRLFFNAIDQHRSYIEKAPSHIKEVFVGNHGDCKHCHNDRDGVCKFRKTYTIENRLIEKCNGITFEFHAPSVPRISDYIALFTEFYPDKRSSHR